MDFMPFGKFKNEPLSSVPDSYILWLVENVEIREPLLSGIAVELRYRGLEVGQAPATRGPDRDMVHKVYKKLAIEYHPDKQGGNGDVMKGINIFRDKLREAGA
jgi:uncharacterized protein (DUF3820 family)